MANGISRHIFQKYAEKYPVDLILGIFRIWTNVIRFEHILVSFVQQSNIFGNNLSTLTGFAIIFKRFFYIDKIQEVDFCRFCFID